MAFDIGTIEGRVKLVYDSKGLTSLDKDLNKVDKSMQQTEKRSSRLGSSLKSGLKVGAAAAGTALAGGLAYGLKESIIEAREAEKIMRLTNNAIKASGGAANVTAKEIENLSTRLSNKTAIDDEVIQSSSNLLLTFRNIRNEAGKNNDIFNQATQTALDMAEAYGMDIPSATKMLAKALQDPANAASQLKRSGAIDEAGVQRIKKMAEEGASILQMQKVLLNDINKAGVRGAAAAAADPIQRLNMVFRNFLEDIGGVFLPFVNKAADALSKFIIQFSNGKGKGGEFRQTLSDVWEVVKSLVPTFKIMGQVILGLLRGFAGLPGPVQGAIAGLLTFALIAPKIAMMIKVFMGLKTAAMGLFAVLRAAPLLMGGVGLVIAGLAVGAFLVIKNWDKVKKFLTSLPGKISGAFSSLKSTITKPFSSAANTIRSVLDSIVGAFRKAINQIKNIAGSVGGAAGGVIDAINPFAAGGKVGPSAGGPQIALIGEGKKDEWVISQEGPRSKNIGYLAEAAQALGVATFAEGGRLDRRIANRRTLIEQKKREFAFTGGVTTDAEYERLLALYENDNGLLPLLREAVKGAPKGQRRIDARFALRDAQMERNELRREKRESKSALKEQKMEAVLERLVQTPFDTAIAQLQTDLSLANAGYGGNAKEITGKLTKELEGRLRLLRQRLGATKDKKQVENLQQAIQSTVSELSGLKDSGAGGPSIIEQMSTAANLRYGLMASLGGNAMAFGLNQSGQKLASANGTNVYLSGEFKLDGKDPHQSVRALSSQLANNIA